MNAAAIRTDGLTKRFGDTVALDHLDIDVQRGEIFGFLGPNGAGKTTTVRLLLNLLRPTAGSAWLMGIPAPQVERAHRHVSYIPGDVVLWPQLTGAETLAYLGALSGQTDPQFRDELIERFQLDANRRVRSYSKGNRQKIALIAAFMTRPDILVLDEPTAGLDPLMEAEFKALAREARELGQTVFLSSHLLDEVEDVCDRVAILRSGELIETASLAELRRLSSTIFEVRFVGAVPSFDDVPGVVGSEPIGRGLRLTVEGSPTALLGRLAAAPVAELRSRTPSLEEIFLTYYDTSEAARGAAVPADPYGS
ncbi:MAG: ATP-binding cassette domain-containing protein [Nocardioidaceae bacterium]